MSQCVNGGVHPNRYVAGDVLAATGVIPGHDLYFRGRHNQDDVSFGLGLDAEEVGRRMGNTRSPVNLTISCIKMKYIIASLLAGHKSCWIFSACCITGRDVPVWEEASATSGFGKVDVGAATGRC